MNQIGRETRCPSTCRPLERMFTAVPASVRQRGYSNPYDAWREINERAYSRLRLSRAAYPIAIVPGFHSAPFIMRERTRTALDLLQNGWVSALMFSGGYRRGGRHEALLAMDEARSLAASMHLDVRDRIFIEPCACHTVTNIRNGFRMLAAMGIQRALLITESRITGQAAVIAQAFDKLARDELHCFVGRMSYLRGPVIPSLPGDANGCRPILSLVHNPITLLVPRREPVAYWVSAVRAVPRRIDPLDARVWPGQPARDRMRTRGRSGFEPLSADHGSHRSNSAHHGGPPDLGAILAEDRDVEATPDIPGDDLSM